MFASSEYAERVLWFAYRSLRMGIITNGRSHAIGQELQSDITDLSHCNKSWGAVPQFYYTGAINSSNAADPYEWRRPVVLLPYADMANKGITTFKSIRNCSIFFACIVWTYITLRSAEMSRVSVPGVSVIRLAKRVMAKSERASSGTAMIAGEILIFGERIVSATRIFARNNSLLILRH